jgi:hypothetical protein
MNRIVAAGLGAGGAITGALLIASMAFAATSYSLFGDAEVVPGGNPGNAAELRSGGDSTYGGVEITGFPADPADITHLSFDYNASVTGGSGGSPRLVAIFSDGTIADLRPLELEAGEWATIDGMTGNNWDTRLGSCGTQYAVDWQTVLNCTDGATIESLFVVNDSGWVYPDGINVLVDNITVNNDVITFDETAGPSVATDKEQCKKGGWQSLVRADGTSFKNQGACVSYTNTGR